MKRNSIVRGCMSFFLIFVLCTGCAGSGTVPGDSTEQEGNSSETESEELPPEALGPVTEETKQQINDMSKAFQLLLNQGTKRFFEGYPVEENFLHWMNKNYGEAVIMDLAYRLFEGYDNPALWFSETGQSMHVLWLCYCKDLQFYTYYLDGVEWLDCASEERITIDFTGDINLADDWHTMLVAGQQPGGVQDCIAPEIVTELQGADLSVINHEFVMSDTGIPLEGKAYTFRAKTSNLQYLELFGADVANIANNHIYDFGAEGLLNTKAILEENGIITMGAGANIKEASAIRYFVANGKKIALVAATQIERYSNYTKEATETTPGVLKTRYPQRYNAVIREAAANSDYVIANVHWGAEGQIYSGSDQYELAENFVEAGADIIIGGHPHRLQGVEYIKGIPVVYSLGNFWFSTGTLYTTIAQVQIDRDGTLYLRAIPCLQKDVKVSILTGAETDGFYKYMADVSKNVVIDTDGYFYDTADGRNEHLKNGSNYESGSKYGAHRNSYDLEGRLMDVVGNLK